MEPKLYKGWSDSEKQIFREWLRDHLRIGPVTISFEKKDGTIREMNCTLKVEDVKQYEKKTDNIKKINEEVCPVFDIDKQEWRSFRFDSITQVQFTL